VARLQSDPIRIDELIETVRGDADGAVAIFLGTVRNHNDGRTVIRLEYHAYGEMAVREMELIENEATRRFGVSSVAVVHRIGVLEIGETSVAVAVGSPHRAQALDACRFVIDTLKQKVPIWKKEQFEGGTTWIEGDAPPKSE
jgi:molybdopterin synthase catalytic subunit